MASPPDWNWLFSSVAQSVAALVGVIGAFLISRILSSEGTFARNRERTGELLRRGERLADRAAARDFDCVNKRLLEYGLEDVARAIEDEDEVLSAQEYYERFEFPTYMLRQEVLPEIELAIRCAVDEKKAPISPWAHLAIAPTPEYAIAARQNLDREQQAICDVRLAVLSHMRDVDEHLARVAQQPDRSIVARITLIAILLLFWAGVLWPLTFLPVGPASPEQIAAAASLFSARAYMLLTAGLVFSALVLSLGAMNERLRHPAGELELLQRELGPERYSRYFQVRVDNGFTMGGGGAA